MHPNVANVNATFPKYPITVEDKGWIYGVWYCGRSFNKRAKLYGGYPGSFLKRALALFPDAGDILHCPSGALDGVPGVTVDLVRDEARNPQIVADAMCLPFADASFDLVLSDPPYSDADSKMYGTPPFPLQRALNEFHRVLRDGGCVGLLHQMSPRVGSKKWEWIGVIGVVCGTNTRMRVFNIYRKK